MTTDLYRSSYFVNPGKRSFVEHSSRNKNNRMFESSINPHHDYSAEKSFVSRSKNIS